MSALVTPAGDAYLDRKVTVEIDAHQQAALFGRFYVEGRGRLVLVAVTGDQAVIELERV